MSDKDIKNIFNNAVENASDADVNTQKIQKTVMERLGKQANGSFNPSALEETVEPVFVTAPAKSFRKAPAFIAAAAAACLGLTAVSTGFFGLNGTSSTLTGGTSNTLEQSETSVSETIEAYISEKAPEGSKAAESTELTETTETADSIETAVPVQSETAEIEDKTPEETHSISSESIDDWKGKQYPLNSNPFTLLDGSKVTVDGNKTIGEQDHNTMNLLLSEKNGRIYYDNGKDVKDITDLISTEVPYIDSYENRESGLTHYIVIGGDVASGKYGYADVFALYERSWYFSSTCNEPEFASENEQWSHEDNTMMTNLISTAIKQISGEEYFLYKGGGGVEDFKSVN